MTNYDERIGVDNGAGRRARRTAAAALRARSTRRYSLASVVPFRSFVLFVFLYQTDANRDEL